jgi:hypothetical protein
MNSGVILEGSEDQNIYVFQWMAEGKEYNMLSVSIDQSFFQYEIQTWFGTTDTTITVPFRLSYRDSDENILVSDEFDLVVVGPVIETCTDAIVYDPTSPVETITVSFASATAGSFDEQFIDEFYSLAVKVSSTDVNCRAVFFCEVYSPYSQAYITLDMFEGEIDNVLGNQRTSEIEFDPLTSNWKAKFSSTDIAAL